jgi:hypothetical protein
VPMVPRSPQCHLFGLDQLEGRRRLEVGHRDEGAERMQRRHHRLGRRGVEHGAGCRPPGGRSGLEGVLDAPASPRARSATTIMCPAYRAGTLKVPPRDHGGGGRGHARQRIRAGRHASAESALPGRLSARLSVTLTQEALQRLRYRPYQAPTTWLPLPCSSGDMVAAAMQYGRRDGAAGRGSRGHGSVLVAHEHQKYAQSLRLRDVRTRWNRVSWS